MIPMELWLSEEMALRRAKAVAKALDLKPKVEKFQAEVAFGDTEARSDMYKVNDYIVETLKDSDDRLYIECSCLAGTPPIDEATGLPKYEPTICYHASAVLLAIAEKEKE